MKSLLRVFFALSIIAALFFTFAPEQNSAKAIKNLKSLETGEDPTCFYHEKLGICIGKTGDSACAPFACEE